MKRTLSAMKRLSHALTECALPLTLLTALSLSGCAGLKKFPTDKLYEFDPKEPVCAEYRVIDYEKLQYEHVRDIPFKDCPPIFGFVTKDIPRVMNWGRDAIEYGKKRCK